MYPPSRHQFPSTKLVQTVLLAFTVAVTFAQELQNGLHIEVTHRAECERRSRNGDTLEMHYKGSLKDGSVFDSSYERHEPFSFTLGRGEVIRGWDEGLQDMCADDRRRLTVPPEVSDAKLLRGRRVLIDRLLHSLHTVTRRCLDSHLTQP